ESINENELSGVISHELAHIELNHVMKKLVKEVGLSVLLSMTTGSGGELVKEIVRLISSSAYDRSLETEADLHAVEYMLNSHLNPEALANFLYRLSNNKDDLSKHLDWVSTHPNPEERAETIIDNSYDRKVTFKPVLTKREWEALQKRIEKDN
ncbi:MAG: M48 family metallopeptidase, partial [Chitinophagaceae bacterium]